MVRSDGIGFLALAGTLIYKGEWQQRGAQRLLADLLTDAVDDRALFGAFAIVHWDGRRLSLFTDWLGNLCVYRDPSGSVWSTSFLAVAESSERLTLNVQGAYEYLFQECTFGTDTVCKEVERIEPERIHGVGKDTWKKRDDPLAGVEIANGSLDDHIDRALESLNPVFDSIANCADGRIDTALSGGFDSRLILALLRVRGVRPRIHVYGTAGDADVRIAKLICEGEGLPLEHVDKSQAHARSPDDRARAIERNYVLFDGYPTDGIFDSGIDLETRSARMSDMYLLLNGGGGEVLRNFYYLRDRSYQLRELLHVFYSRFDPRACTAAFDEEQYYRRLEEKLAKQLGKPVGCLTRLDVERSYPLFRCRFWTARNTSINCRLGFSMTPLIEPYAVRAALAIPVRLKNMGTFEAALIKRVDPRLASYPSSYGYSFDRLPSLAQRWRFAVSLLRPPWFRRYAFRMKQRFGVRRSENRELSLPPSSESRSSRIVRSGRIKDEPLHRRSATLEYLIDHLAIVEGRA